MDEQHSQCSPCPVEFTVNMVGGKYKLLILHQLATHGVRRFNELRRDFLNITQRTLTRQLRELESDGLINRQVYSEIPPKVEYSLSETGKSLYPIFLQIEKWGLDYMQKIQNNDRQ
ncbi:winged helix-turn-helix transcriptional regulator [Paenibacillus prosopidis]|uniref:HxlR family transcriptional regulator n=1 Tax=Paenibacillus prosopidis TaxID=630520 RepID=A0A368VYZ9_9BACL|nr:helix-turn-helix domain-containing protein [Paenibacillus prosopidis]RCW47522.1 HxlR family transcriptional regulator [Paenibacillus prosopidis]